MQSFITNLTNRASTSVNGFDYNSFCEAWEKPLAAGDGLYELCGDTDDTVDIDAYFETPIIDLGSQRDKRLRFVYLGFESDGNLEVSVSVDGGSYRAYSVIPKKTGRQRIRIPIGRNGHGRYWQLKINNVDGSFFAIDHMSVLINERSEGIV